MSPHACNLEIKWAGLQPAETNLAPKSYSTWPAVSSIKLLRTSDAAMPVAGPASSDNESDMDAVHIKYMCQKGSERNPS
jgi:hypothetical protein